MENFRCAGHWLGCCVCDALFYPHINPASEILWSPFAAEEIDALKG